GGSILKTTHGTTVSIQEPRSQLPGITIFPNPVHDLISIGMNGKMGDDVRVRIFTVMGKQLMHHEFRDRRQIQLDVSSLLKGVYLVVIETTLGKETRKLVKL
ncbi:MAG: T9SS type A sorting domain-containing protein, partial [Bacteroidales bacterium]